MHHEDPRLLSPKSTLSGKISVALSLFVGAALVSCDSSNSGGGQSIPGLDGFSAGVVGDNFYLGFTAPTLNWDVGLTIPIPGVAGATIGAAPSVTGQGTVFQFTAPMSSLSGILTSYPDSALPDGRALPDVTTGELPRFDVLIDKYTVSFYASNDAFAIFFPIQFQNAAAIPAPFLMTATIDDSRGNLLGKAYLVPPGLNGQGSGLFILLPDLGGSPSGLN